MYTIVLPDVMLVYNFIFVMLVLIHTTVLGDASAINLPTYGNYCGAGTRSRTAQPIDAIDSFCKKHDQCYGTKGYLNCVCDNDFVSKLNSIDDNTLSQQQRLFVDATQLYFTNSPCTCRRSWSFFFFRRCVGLPYSGRKKLSCRNEC